MFDNKKNNPGCDFSVEIVSYLYDDFSGSGKKTFEKHLLNCAFCADEIAGIAFVRSSIQDWKELEFNNLATPKIEIEFEQNSTIPIKTIEQKTSWLDKFNNFLSPLIVKTATGFAAVAILFGLGWFIFGSLQNNRTFVTANKEKEIKNQISPSEKNVIADKETDIENSHTNISEQNEVADNSDEKSLQRKQISGKDNVSKNIELKDNSSITAKNEKRKEIKKTKQNLPDSKQNKPITVEQKPSLTEFAVDDKSEDDIRLSDIFDEIGSDR